MDKEIAEKLGVTPIVSFDDDRGLKVCNQKPVREKEKIFNEMLEALIESLLFYEQINGRAKDNAMDMYIGIAIKQKIAIIEKACYPKKWDEIKEIL